MPAEKVGSGSSENSHKLDRIWKDSRVRFIARCLECIAAFIAIWMLALMWDERDDRRASRAMRAWGVLADTTMKLESGRDSPFISSEATGQILSGMTKDALELLSEYDQSLDRVFLHGLSLESIQLKNASLKEVNFVGADLSGANFQCAILDGSELKHAVLVGADFRGANLSNATLDYADFLGADLTDTDLTAASLKCAKNLTQSQIDVACSDPGRNKGPPVFNIDDCDDGDEKVQREPIEWSTRPCPK